MQRNAEILTDRQALARHLCVAALCMQWQPTGDVLRASVMTACCISRQARQCGALRAAPEPGEQGRRRAGQRERVPEVAHNVRLRPGQEHHRDGPVRPQLHSRPDVRCMQARPRAGLAWLHVRCATTAAKQAWSRLRVGAPQGRTASRSSTCGGLNGRRCERILWWPTQQDVRRRLLGDRVRVEGGHRTPGTLRQARCQDSSLLLTDRAALSLKASGVPQGCCAGRGTRRWSAQTTAGMTARPTPSPSLLHTGKAVSCLCKHRTGRCPMYLPSLHKPLFKVPAWAARL